MANGHGIGSSLLIAGGAFALFFRVCSKADDVGRLARFGSKMDNVRSVGRMGENAEDLRHFRQSDNSVFPNAIEIIDYSNTSTSIYDALTEEEAVFEGMTADEIARHKAKIFSNQMRRAIVKNHIYKTDTALYNYYDKQLFQIIKKEVLVGVREENVPLIKQFTAFNQIRALLKTGFEESYFVTTNFDQNVLDPTYLGTFEEHLDRCQYEFLPFELSGLSDIEKHNELFSLFSGIHLIDKQSKIMSILTNRHLKRTTDRYDYYYYLKKLTSSTYQLTTVYNNEIITEKQLKFLNITKQDTLIYSGEINKELEVFYRYLSKNQVISLSDFYKNL